MTGKRIIDVVAKNAAKMMNGTTSFKQGFNSSSGSLFSELAEEQIIQYSDIVDVPIRSLLSQKHREKSKNLSYGVTVGVVDSTTNPEGETLIRDFANCKSNPEVLDVKKKWKEKVDSIPDQINQR